MTTEAPFKIKTVISKWEDVIEVPQSGVLCIVGANNVGKSQFLHEVVVALDQPSNNPAKVLLDRVVYDLRLSREDCGEWLEEHAPKDDSHPGAVRYMSANGTSSSLLQEIEFQILMHDGNYLGELANYFVHSLPFSGRANILSEDIGAGNMQISGSPLNRLFRNPELEVELSSICQRHFGFPLILDRFNGKVQIRVGRPDLPEYQGGWYTPEYANTVLQLPPLITQGDGVKNYIGIALNMLTTNTAVTLLDEPEAFLHPAQSRGLGRFLGEIAGQRQSQLIVATHDRDFVVGLLNSGTPLTVLRLTREQNVTRFQTISPSDIERVWENPFLRFSNVLQGLFHKVVVLCEGDADCMWYAATLSHIGEEQGLDTNEALFVSGGGKEQLSRAYAALRALGVEVMVIADFDSLMDNQTMPAIIEAMDHPNNNLLQKIESLRLSVTNRGARDLVKENGLNNLTAGTETTLGKEILAGLANIGVLVVPIGEMESFHKDFGRKGIKWVSNALGARLHETDDKVRDFVKPIYRRLASV